MAGIVYILCAITSLCCAVLLFRGYSQNKFRLLFWTANGFVGFTLSNILLFIDQKVIHHYDLSIHRTIPAFLGMVIMVYGLITEET